MQTVLALTVTELSTAANHIQTVVHIHLQHLQQTELLRTAIHQGDIIDAERVLHRRVLIQSCKHRVRIEASLELNHQAQTVVPVRQINNIGNARELLRVRGVLNLLDNLLRAHTIRELRDDQRLLARGHLLELNLGARTEHATARLIRLLHAIQAHDGATRRQVRARDELHDVLEGRVRVLDQMPSTSDHLTRVVRGDVGRHTHRNTRRTVDQKVRERGRQNLRLQKPRIIVRNKIDDVLIEVIRHINRRISEPRLRITRRRRAVIERTEVAVPINQRQTQRERLRHAHHRIVNRGITVWVQLTHDLTGHTRTLDVPLVRRQTHLPHHVQNAALNRLETIARIRQRTRINHRIRVLKEGRLHLTGDIHIDDVFLNVLPNHGSLSG